PTPSTPSGHPPPNPPTTAASTTPAHDHTQRNSEPSRHLLNPARQTTKPDSLGRKQARADRCGGGRSLVSRLWDGAVAAAKLRESSFGVDTGYVRVRGWSLWSNRFKRAGAAVGRSRWRSTNSVAVRLMLPGVASRPPALRSQRAGNRPILRCQGRRLGGEVH